MTTYPSIPEPTNDPESLRNTILALKELVEILTRQRKPIEAASVTWQDLVDQGLIEESDVPKR